MVQNGVIDWGITDEAVIEVMGVVPRHAFVLEEHISLAYNNHPLPIGYGQTISQPYVVGRMVEALRLQRCAQHIEPCRTGGAAHRQRQKAADYSRGGPHGRTTPMVRSRLCDAPPSIKDSN